MKTIGLFFKNHRFLYLKTTGFLFLKPLGESKERGVEYRGVKESIKASDFPDQFDHLSPDRKPAFNGVRVLPVIRHKDGHVPNMQP